MNQISKQRRKMKLISKSRKSNEDIVEKFVNLEINIIDNGIGISEQGFK